MCWLKVKVVFHCISSLGSGGQRSRSHKAKDRFGDPSEASFSTRFVSSRFSSLSFISGVGI